MSIATLKRRYNYASSGAYFAACDAIESAMRGEQVRVSRPIERFVSALLSAFPDASGEDIASFAYSAAQRRAFGLSAVL